MSSLRNSAGTVSSLNVCVHVITTLNWITKTLYHGIMADFFNFLEDDDYGDMFITQSTHSDKPVSLDDDMEVGFKSVRDPQYLDISEDEDTEHEWRLR